ncbi:MAG: hypothetical protein K2X47_12765, partial [Bdellovibrionales bacterium]|nr:hypothetical protein [Bdellovibrionales bacterium]
MDSSTDQQKASKELSVYRRYLAVAGGVYLAWWFVVESILPNAFNPFFSRFFVFFIIYGVLGL